jgi:hypothetical protein
MKTTARWSCGDRQERSWPHGEWVTGRFRKFAYSRVSMDQFPYGSDTPSRWPRRDLQWCQVCAPSSGTINIGVDHEGEYLATRTAHYIRREHAITFRWTDTIIPEMRFHVLVDCRGVLRDQWPQHRKIIGADIVANGWMPMPGCRHWSGEGYYNPVTDRLGRFTIVPWSPGLLAAIAADQDDFKAAGREAGHGGGGGTGGGGQGHDGEVAAMVMADVLRGLPKGQCYQRWLKVAIPRNGWPFTREDFERHYGDETQGALAKANAIRAAEAAEQAELVKRIPDFLAWYEQAHARSGRAWREKQDRTQFAQWARQGALS